NCFAGSLITVTMDSHFLAQPMRFIDERGHFSRRQLRRVDLIGKGKHAARNRSLNHVRAILHLKTDSFSNFIGSICNTIRVIRLASEKEIAKALRGIEMSAGGSDSFRGNQHSWADDQPFVN